MKKWKQVEADVWVTADTTRCIINRGGYYDLYIDGVFACDYGTLKAAKDGGLPQGKPMIDPGIARLRKNK